MLENIGLTHEQAEVHLRVIEGAMQDNMATKLDLYEVRSQLSGEIQGVRSDIQEIRGEISSLKNESSLLEYRLIHKMGLMFTAAVTILSGVAALLKFAF